MSEPTIPPPDAKPYIEARIGSMNYRGDGLRCLWDGNGRNEDAQAVLTELHRRFHAAESERDRLAERLRRAEELLEPFRTHVGGCSDVACPNCRIYRYFSESNPTEKQA